MLYSIILYKWNKEKSQISTSREAGESLAYYMENSDQNSKKKGGNCMFHISTPHYSSSDNAIPERTSLSLIAR